MYGAVLSREDTFVKVCSLRLRLHGGRRLCYIQVCNLLPQDLQDYCSNHDYLSSRKKEILHKTWSDRVYEPLRKTIVDQMDSENYNKYKTRKDQLYREYIEHLNKKVTNYQWQAFPTLIKINHIRIST